MNENYAYVTIINTTKYIDGVICLERSLREVKSRYPFYAVITGSDRKKIKYELNKYSINTVEIERKISIPECVLKRNISGGHENWNYSFDKLFVYDLIQFDKVIFLDADLYILKNLDHLFKKEHMTAATSGKYYPGKESWTKLNSGLMVIKPEKDLLNKVITKINKLENITGYVGDQEIIWDYYDKWETKNNLHLGENYNVFFEHLEYYIKNLNYTLYGTRGECDKEIYVVHFVNPKPWLLSKKLRYKYFIYNLLKGNFSIAKLLYNYYRLIPN